VIFYCNLVIFAEKPVAALAKHFTLRIHQWFPNCGTRRPSRWCTIGPTFCFSSQNIHSQL